MKTEESLQAEEELDLTEEQIESIKELMTQEKTPKEIAEMLEIDPEIIQKYIQRKIKLYNEHKISSEMYHDKVKEIDAI